MRHARVVVGAVGLVLGLGLAACGSGDGYGSSGGGTNTTVAPATGGPPGATIAGYAFSVNGDVAAGTPFTVTNNDGVTHTFTNPDGAFDVQVSGGGSQEVTIATPGTYDIICKIHSSMKGSITVT